MFGFKNIKYKSKEYRVIYKRNVKNLLMAMTG